MPAWPTLVRYQCRSIIPWLTTNGATPACPGRPAGVCHARGRPMTPPKPVKVIALITLLIGVALMLAALLF